MFVVLQIRLINPKPSIMYKILLLFLMLFSGFNASSQVLFQEDFEGGTIPTGWEVETLASDGGWNIGSNFALSSQFFPIPSNGSNFIMGTNDDSCNCNKSSDRLIMPAIDLSNVNSAILIFDKFYADGNYQGFQENATIEVSNDKLNWAVLQPLIGEGGWITTIADLQDFIGQDQVYISFHYRDSGGWMFGCAVDNISVEVPLTLDASLISLNNLHYGEIGNPVQIHGEVYNNSISVINTLEMSYSINGVNMVTEEFSGLSISPYTSYEFSFESDWIPEIAGDTEITVEITSVNGSQDDSDTNDSFISFTEVFESITRDNKVMEILNSIPVLIPIASSFDGLDQPTDLDFFPILGRDELWVINQRNEDDGGSTLTISDASLDSREMLIRVDGNAWHFMSLPTAMEFSNDNYNFASSPGVQDANHSGGTFTGPTLWSSDPAIYAQPSGGNGSHLDMLHGSPFSMGIAHEKDNVFWIYDNWNKDIVRYDFVEDHGPGNDDHSDGIVRRYSNLGILADMDIPNHIIVDKDSGWLYFVDNGNDRVMRLDINSGSPTQVLPLINEPLAEHTSVTGFTVEEIINEGLERPCGIEIIDDYLLVGDYSNGEVVVYDMNNDFSEMGRIQADQEGMTGIKVGPDGNLWVCNRIFHTLTKVEAGEPTSVYDAQLSEKIEVYPNPTSDILNLRISSELEDNLIGIELIDVTGKLIFKQSAINTSKGLDLSTIGSGVYNLKFDFGDKFTNQRLIISR